MAHHDDDGVGYAYGEGEYGLTPAGAGHEHTDANVWVIVKFGLWLAIAAIIVHLGVGVLFWLFVEQRQEADHQFPLAVGQERRLPAAPRLQAIPVNDIYRFRLQEDRVLQNYGWIDRNGGRVQIPIAEAMRLVVEREGAAAPGAAAPADPAATAAVPASGGPAATAQPEAGATSAVEDPGLLPSDSSSGRTLERRRQ